jgi:hypothetical protein
LILRNGDTLYNGPYTIHETEGCTTIQTLKDSLRTIQQYNQDKRNPPDAPIRKYLTLLLTDPSLADVQWARIVELHGHFLEEIKLNQPFINGKTILSDLIVLNSMNVKTV